MRRVEEPACSCYTYTLTKPNHKCTTSSSSCPIHPDCVLLTTKTIPPPVTNKAGVCHTTPTATITASDCSGTCQVGCLTSTTTVSTCFTATVRYDTIFSTQYADISASSHPDAKLINVRPLRPLGRARRPVALYPSASSCNRLPCLLLGVLVQLQAHLPATCRARAVPGARQLTQPSPQTQLVTSNVQVL